MITGITLWNEPNNLSHWDFEADPGWKDFSTMISFAAKQIRKECPSLKLILGGISPIDPSFIRLLQTYDIFDYLDIIGVHGFPLDWNHWKIDEWPEKISQIESTSSLPVWITEVGASSFGADEVQVFGLERTAELLSGRLNNVFWYSLLDLPPTWEATTRHKESEGSSYYRHFYLGLYRADGTPKPAARRFNPEMGICQWLHFNDPRLGFAVSCMKQLNIKRIRTGISWADWYRPGAAAWFDTQMKALEDFDVTVTLCFTPPSRGKKPCHTSVPVDLEEFGWFAQQVVKKYAVK
jgi:beta-xylosidase